MLAGCGLKCSTAIEVARGQGVQDGCAEAACGVVTAVGMAKLSGRPFSG
jgi:hypothetical protein